MFVMANVDMMSDFMANMVFGTFVTSFVTRAWRRSEASREERLTGRCSPGGRRGRGVDSLCRDA